MRLWNLDHQPVVVENDQPAVLPGESYEFTKEQIEAGVAGNWSDKDPRKGLADEAAFKRRRDGKETAADLRKRAEEAGLEVPKKAKKAEIAELLEQAEKTAAEAAEQGAGENVPEPEGSEGDNAPAPPDETEPAQPEKE
jgi:hypothetical protein